MEQENPSQDYSWFDSSHIRDGIVLGHDIEPSEEIRTKIGYMPNMML